VTDQVKQIGERIRTLREISDLSVEHVASETGVSVAEYTSYEGGEVDIPISFLLKLSQLYGVDTTAILTGQSPRLTVCAVTRKDMGVDIDRAHHYIYKNLAYNFNHRKIEPLLVTVLPDPTVGMETNSHSGHEFDYVLEGVLKLRVGDQEMELRPGDSAYYDSIHPHAMQAAGGKKAVFLAMVIP